MKTMTTSSARQVFAAILLILLSLPVLHAQDITMGLQKYDNNTSFEGYTLFSPMSQGMTYLIDNYGRQVHSWQSPYPPAASFYLLENGNLLRSTYFQIGGDAGGGVQEIDWDGNVIWEFQHFGEGYSQHHDIEPMPNGNVLLLCRETISRSEAIANGRDTAVLADSMLTPDYIIEVEPDGMGGASIVWEWRIWDHIIQDFDSTKANYGNVAEHPELIDLNYALNNIADWVHANGIEYNPELDQIVISAHQFGEIWIIDHSTTTAEAAGHSGGDYGMGGDLLYRWGNPRTYRAGSEDDQMLFGQHDAQWIKPGIPGEDNILIFNNGARRPGEDAYSSVEEITPPVDQLGHYIQPDPGMPFGPDTTVWTFVEDPPADFYSNAISGAQRLANGNTLICEGMSGRFFEVTPAGDMVWEYINPVTSTGAMDQGDQILPFSNRVFRTLRYGPDFPGFDGKLLSPTAAIENYSIEIIGTSHSPEKPTADDSVVVTARIIADNPLDSTRLIYDTGSGEVTVTLYDDGNHHDGFAGDSVFGGVIPPQAVSTGVDYYISAIDDTAAVVYDPPIAPLASYGYTVNAAFICGDSNGDESVNVSDAVYIINFIFAGGNMPDPIESADANCDLDVNVSDAVWLINFVFTGGNDPCDSDGDGNSDC